MRKLFNFKKQNPIFRFLLILLIAIPPLSLSAQAQTNFSGNWEFDKAKSDKEERGDASFDGTIVLEIRQDADSIIFTNRYLMPGRDWMTIRPDKFLANETETQDNSWIDPARRFVKWSPDKKVLTTNYVMTPTIDGVPQDFLTAKTYIVSDDGKTLTVTEYKKSYLGENTVKKVYIKK